MKVRNYPMKKYAVTLTGHYEKTISVYADTPEQAAEKVKIILLDTDLFLFPRKILSAEKPRLRTQIRKMERKKIRPMKRRTSV